MARGHRARAQSGTMPSANGALPALVWDVKRRRVYLDRADRVRWRVLSVDTHVTEGDYSFDVTR